jgi:hypothetical protein
LYTDERHIGTQERIITPNLRRRGGGAGEDHHTECEREVKEKNQ